MELAELAAKFNMTLGEAKAALNESNIYPFTSNPKVEGEKLEQYKRVLAKKAGISVPSHTTGIRLLIGRLPRLGVDANFQIRMLSRIRRRC